MFSTALFLCCQTCLGFNNLYKCLSSCVPAGVPTDCAAYSYARSIGGKLGVSYPPPADFIYAPVAVAVSPNGDILVADIATDAIKRFASNGTFLSMFGQHGNKAGQLDYPVGIATDSAGNIYVSESNNHRVQKLTADGTYLSHVGAGYVGQGNGEFWFPHHIWIDKADNIYVADSWNLRIQKFSSSWAFLRGFGDLDGVPFGPRDWSVRGVPGVSVDNAGNVYLADADNNCIQQFAADGTLLATFGSFGIGDGQFDRPFAVVPDNAGHIYVLDQGNNRIQKLDATTGDFISSFGSQGSGDGEFFQAWGLHMGPDGSLYVADTANNRVQVFSCTAGV